MNHECSKCGCALSDGDDISDWEVAEVTEYQRKVATFTGFPSGETHTIQGWKIQPLRRFETSFCKQCSKSMRKAIRRAKLIRFRNAAIACILETLLGFALAHDWIDADVGIFFAIGGGLICFFLIILWLMTTQGLEKRKEQLYEMQKTFGRRVIERPAQGFPTEKGQLFCVERNQWVQFSDRFKEMEALTGWSYFLYLREYAYNSEQCTPEQGAAFLGVAHLGLYLTNGENNQRCSESIGAE